MAWSVAAVAVVCAGCGSRAEPASPATGDEQAAEASSEPAPSTGPTASSQEPSGGAPRQAGAGDDQTLDQAETVEARLEHAPHETPSGAPHVVAHLPAGLSVDEPLSVVVFLHGWSGCARALAGAGAVACRPGGPPRNGWGLGARHAAAEDGSVLVVPQLAWLARDGSAGRLVEDGFFRDMLAEVLGGPLSEAVGRELGIDDLGAVTLVAHSAGYESALAILEHGGVDVRHVALLDALYGEADRFAEWVAGDPERRLVSLYTGRASTYRESRRLARLATESLGAVSVTVDPDAPLSETLPIRRVVVDRSPHPHGAIPTRQLEEVLRAFNGPRGDLPQ